MKYEMWEIIEEGRRLNYKKIEGHLNNLNFKSNVKIEEIEPGLPKIPTRKPQEVRKVDWTNIKFTCPKIRVYNGEK